MTIAIKTEAEIKFEEFLSEHEVAGGYVVPAQKAVELWPYEMKFSPDVDGDDQ